MDIGIEVEWCRNPVRRELIRIGIALFGLCALLAGVFGYHWAWEVFENGILR